MIAKLADKPEKVLMKTVYCNTIMDMMKDDPRVVQVEADLAGAMASGVIKQRYPEQFVDCGIMESHAMGLSCGMSQNDKIPFVHSFASFITRRTADQMFMSGCYANANVKVIGSDPGVTAEDNGGTHMCFEDIGITRSMAGMTVLDVAEPHLLESVLRQMRDTHGMYYMRMERGNAPAYYDADNTFEIGKAKLLREGSDVTIIACGIMVPHALKAAELLQAKGKSARVVDMFTIKPVDVEMICESVQKTGHIVTVENHNIVGGLGAAVAEALVENCPAPMKRVGIQDRFGEVGNLAYLLKTMHLLPEDIVAACEDVMKR